MPGDAPERTGGKGAALQGVPQAVAQGTSASGSCGLPAPFRAHSRRACLISETTFQPRKITDADELMAPLTGADDRRDRRNGHITVDRRTDGGRSVGSTYIP